MSTLEEHREFGEHVDASGLSVREAHHAVCAARMTHCRHGRARLVHGGRRTRRRNVSNRRAAMVARGGTESAPTLQTDSHPGDSRCRRCGTNLTQALSKPVNRAGTEPGKELS